MISDVCFADRAAAFLLFAVSPPPAEVYPVVMTKNNMVYMGTVASSHLCHLVEQWLQVITRIEHHHGLSRMPPP